MHVDARTLPDATLIEGDLCVAGAGPAGIALALEWEGRGARVILLEGGGFHLEAPVQDRYRGESVGLPYYPLESARLHFFGGASGHWGDSAPPSTPSTSRSGRGSPAAHGPSTGTSWSPSTPGRRSSWSSVHTTSIRNRGGGRNPRLVPLPLDPAKVWTKMWQFSSPPTPFGRRYRERITGSANVHLLTHANAVDVVLHRDGRAVSELRVSNLAGCTHHVLAHRYVLAWGAIQNARLLLASNGIATRGVGNDADLVGRHFMEHVEMVERGEILPDRPDAPRHEPWKDFTLVARHEQAPNPDSRIMLSTERDALGVPRTRLDWRLSELELRSMRETWREVGRSGAGRVRLLEWLQAEGEDWPDFVSGGWHHMGTTRMHRDPRQGVVDPDCRVHGIGNLYMAGASVFPTGGCANPTLTLLALALRLSDHLK